VGMLMIFKEEGEKRSVVSNKSRFENHIFLPLA
jgi:hypothetical protein